MLVFNIRYFFFQMGKLKDELEKEKELRKIAEDKLLEILDHEKRMEAQRREKYV